MQIAIWETRRLWPNHKYVDVALSLGTGHLRSNQKTVRGGSHGTEPSTAPLIRHGFARRLLTAWTSRLDAENEWVRFSNTLPPDSRSRSVRLNLSLRSPPQLDDISAMQDPEKQSEVFLQQADAKLQLICDNLLASSFYFELDNLPRRVDGKWQCGGFVHSRLPLTGDGRAQLCKWLHEKKASFVVNNESFSSMVGDQWTLPTPYRCRISFLIDSLEQELRIVLVRLRTPSLSISGMPTSVAQLIRSQMLDAPFGRVDHISGVSKPIKRKLPESDPLTTSMLQSLS